MAINLIDGSSGLDELGKAIPSAIQGYYEAEDRKLKRMEIAAKLAAEKERKERQQALDRATLVEQGYEVPTGEADVYGLMNKGMLQKRPGFISKDDLSRQKTEADISLSNAKRNEILSNAKNPAKNLTEAQKALDKAYGKEYSSFIASGGYTTLNSAVNELENQIEKIKTVQPSKYTGMLPEGRTRSLVAPDATAIQQGIEKVVQGTLRETLGAQFTEKEGQQVMARMYNPNLTWQENYKRAKSELEKIKARADAKMRAAKEFEEKGTLAQFKGSRAAPEEIKVTEEIKEWEGRRYKKNASGDWVEVK